MTPSLPGYGFSAEPASVGWGPGRTASAWAELMRRLGYTRFVAQRGDVGAAVTDVIAIQAPGGLAGIHLNFLRRPPREIAAALVGAARVPALPDAERAAFDTLKRQFGKGYVTEQRQSPQTIGFALNDSPAGLAAWVLDHNTDAYEMISRAFVEDNPVGGLTRDAILDNLTLYWVTGTATPAARMYRESVREAAAVAGQQPPRGHAAGQRHGVPRRDLPGASELGREGLPSLVYFGEVGKGGHFAAWEEPQLFAEELRAAFRTLR